MEVITIAFHTISCLLALLATVLLLFVNKERKHSNRLLAAVLIIFALQNLMLVLLFSRLILKAPIFLRVLAPTTFLIGPAAYLYIRSILKDELDFKKFDWLLLVPAILVVFNFLPYYLLPVEEKTRYLEMHFYNSPQPQDAGRGLLPTSIYYLTRVLWSGIFLFAGFRLIKQFRKYNSISLVEKNKILLAWLFLFNSLLTAVLIAALFKIFIPPIKNTQITFADLVISATILLIGLHLFLRPQILYGLFQPAEEMVQIINESESPKFPAEHVRHKTHVENYFQVHQPYLQPDYSLEQMVTDTKLPRYLLSAFINREYGIGFREFLNRYRVDYFKENLDNPAWKNLTLEAIAEECGFNSRITFISNFKKITGTTPSEYIKAASANRSKT
jgi:AraC-like DNA-binding protein